MPNLSYDPQNPSDLMDRPIAEGDIVAWGTTYGRSPAVCVARVERIRYFMKNPNGYGKNIDCLRHQADGYQLVLEPIKSTGSVTNSAFKKDPLTGKWTHVPLSKPKTKTIHLVKNVVKLEPLI